MSRRQGKYVNVDVAGPIAAAMCDRCGQLYNRTELAFQYQWAGSRLYNTGDLVCIRRCLDVPTDQLRVVILPPDPPPVLNARVPNFAYEEYISRITEIEAVKNPPWGAGPQTLRCFQDGETVKTLQYLYAPPTGVPLFVPPVPQVVATVLGFIVANLLVVVEVISGNVLAAAGTLSGNGVVGGTMITSEVAGNAFNVTPSQTVPSTIMTVTI